jgi:hypothetical protein
VFKGTPAPHNCNLVFTTLNDDDDDNEKGGVAAAALSTSLEVVATVEEVDAPAVDDVPWKSFLASSNMA